MQRYTVSELVNRGVVMILQKNQELSLLKEHQERIGNKPNYKAIDLSYIT
jgi:hypothetical protein